MSRGHRRWSTADARSGRVAFVSHCLLNETVRYPGGATCPGAVPEFVAGYVERGIGLCQMPCPEQRVWGGVRKRHLLRLYGLRPLRWWLVRRATLAITIAWTRIVYRRLARRVAGEVADYIEGGFDVVEIVGVGGSPSCGVHTTLDLDGAVAALARCDGDTDRRATNRDVVAANVISGRGIFFTCLDRALRSRGITVTCREHDLVTELTDAGAVALANTPAVRSLVTVTRPSRRTSYVASLRGWTRAHGRSCSKVRAHATRAQGP
jgi:predicted secreted protein